MGKKFRIFLKSFTISMICCAVFVGAGYYYINKNLVPAENKAESVPYSQENPENAGILFEINGNNTFVYFDFENEKMFISLTPEEANSGEIYGYNVDYQIVGNSNVLAEIIDYISGIELTVEDSKLRYTGIQITEILRTTDDSQIKRSIIKAICTKISNTGVALDFFANIIENSTTNLTIPDCYFWNKKLDILCRNLQIID